MSFFGRKDKSLQNDDFEEVTEVNVPADSSDVPVEEAVTLVPDESADVAAEEEVEVVITGDSEDPVPPVEEAAAVDFTAEEPVIVEEAAEEPPVPAEEAGSGDAVPAEYVPASDEDDEPVHEVYTEDKVPIGKYKLDNLYREIGEEYCRIHSDDPETDFREKVGIVNSIKKQSEEIRNQLTDICRSPWMMLLILLLTATLVIPVIQDHSPAVIAAQIPEAVIDIGLIMIFFSALAKKLTRPGFTLINIVLTLYLIVCFIPVITMLILGIFMKLRGDVEYSTLSTSLIVIAVLLGLVCAFFFGGLKKTVVSARTVAGGGLVQVKSSFFVSIIIFLSLIFNVASLIMTTVFRDATVSFLQDVVKQANDYFKEANLSDIVEATSNVGAGDFRFVIANAACKILLLIVVLVLLSKIRNKDRMEEEAAEEEEAVE